MNRKDAHVHNAIMQYGEKETDFESIHFVHQSLSHQEFKSIDLSTTIFDRKFDRPFYINAMSGGSAWTKKINAMLAEVARATQLPMAPGSVSAALKDPSVADSFTIIRDMNPNGFIMANLGADKTLEDAKRAVDLLEADAFQIHLNTPQEIVMPEGDRDFRKLEDNIVSIVEGLDIPVMVKETGFGMSYQTMHHLQSLGVRTIDISGTGGTNFAEIENARREHKDFAYMTDWGQSTAISLLEAQPLMNQTTILASGGVKTPMHILKSLALGASAVGMSVQFLHGVLTEGVPATIKMVEEYDEQLRLLMMVLDCQNIDDLLNTDLIISGKPAEWSRLRRINIEYFASRSQSK
jgi:isopentenyl-diphosphate delta-isomerase